jgi:hypothetical protein
MMNYGGEVCWINNRQSSFYFVGIPLLIISLANITLYIRIVISIKFVANKVQGSF